MWFVHCHLDFHMETGMGFVLKVGDSNNFPKYPENWPKCGSFKYKKTVDNNSATTFAMNNNFLNLFIYIFYQMFFK